MTEVLEVFQARFSFEYPWEVPASARPVSLVRSVDGGSTRLKTEAAVYYDAEALFVIFRGEDDSVLATYREHDQPLYQEDVVEVFLAPERLSEYFELEVNPLGTTFDARIESPDGSRNTLRTDLGWNCRGFWTAICRDFQGAERSRFSVVLSIPFETLGRPTPRSGESWRANFYRIDRAREGDEYSAWRPTTRNPPDFHVPAAFGELRF